MRHLLFTNVQTGHQSHTVHPGRQQQHSPFPCELDESECIALANKHDPDDQATTADRSDQFREPCRKPFEPAKQKRGRPIQVGNELWLAQPTQYVEPDGTCKRRPSKGCSMRTCFKRDIRSSPRNDDNIHTCSHGFSYHITHQHCPDGISVCQRLCHSHDIRVAFHRPRRMRP